MLLSIVMLLTIWGAYLIGKNIKILFYQLWPKQKRIDYHCFVGNTS
ncbi:hypothetical protein LLT5_09820 [Lactococcus cremoris subsp. cremoris TIFN5]|nr:hypothetical protein LLT5_09820 [Lactococcus cremoris subsp. cremoris TIFN5]